MANLCRNMIHFDALAFSECRSKEVMIQCLFSASVLNVIIMYREVILIVPK